MAGYPGEVFLGEGNHPGKPLKAKQASNVTAAATAVCVIVVIVVIVVVVVVDIVVDGAAAVLVARWGEDEHLLSHPDLTGRKQVPCMYGLPILFDVLTTRRGIVANCFEVGFDDVIGLEYIHASAEVG